MFSYCKRTMRKDGDQTFFNYNMSPLQTPNGFKAQPFLCRGLNVPRFPMKQVPAHLYDLENTLHGRNRSEQVMCQNEQELPNFSTYQMPAIGLNPIPTGPTALLSTVSVRPLDGTLCRHVTMTTPCGHNCACSLSCTCKDLMADRNKQPYRAAAPRMAAVPCDRMRF